MVILEESVFSIRSKNLRDMTCLALEDNTLIAQRHEEFDEGLYTLECIGSSVMKRLDGELAERYHEARRQLKSGRRVVEPIDVIERDLRVFKKISYSSRTKPQGHFEDLSGFRRLAAKIKKADTKVWVEDEPIIEKFWTFEGKEWYTKPDQRKGFLDKGVRPNAILLNVMESVWDNIDEGSVIVKQLSGPEALQAAIKLCDAMPHIDKFYVDEAARESDPEIKFSVADGKRTSIITAFFSQEAKPDELSKMLKSLLGVTVNVKPLSGVGYTIGETTLEHLITSDEPK